MAKKIISIFLAALLLIIALFMFLYVALDFIKTPCAIFFVGVRYQHLRYEMHGAFRSELVCVFASFLSSVATYVKNLSIALGFASVAIIVVACMTTRSNNKIKGIGKLLLIAAFLGIFVSNLIFSFISSMSVVRALINQIIEINYFDEVVYAVVTLLRHAVSQLKYWTYALAALLGGIYVLTTMLSKKAKKDKAELKSAPKADGGESAEKEQPKQKKVKGEGSQIVSFQVPSDEYIDIDAPFHGEVI